MSFLKLETLLIKVFPFLLVVMISLGLTSEAAVFNIQNNCPYIVWAAAVPGGGRRLNRGETWTINVSPGTKAARIWARTGCNFDGAGRGRCQTGDCGGVLQCQGYGQPPNTLAEYALNQWNNLDFFDISLVDGFNVPMEFSPTSAGCSRGIRCTADINGQCPSQLRASGGCNNPCTVFKTDQYCCNSGNCGPTNFSRFFKDRCPDAYSYPKDDQTSTFTCPGSTIEYPKKLLHSLPKPISSIFLPHASFDDLPADVVIETRIPLSVTRSLPTIRQSLKAMTESTRLVALVIDMFCLHALDVAKELNILPYVFYYCNPLSLSFVFHLPKLDETTTCKYRDLPEPFKLPGCVSVHGLDLMNLVQDRKNPFYRAALNMVKQFHITDRLILNTFVDLEPGALKAMKEGFYNNPPVYPVGPVVQTGSSGFDECLGWLDKHPQGSVLYVSFGSSGTLPQEQMTELAFGLEMSGTRFLLVVKSPHDEEASATYFDVGSNKDPFDYLPKGFLERARDVGLVVSSWALLVPVLSHGSTGGFLSPLESIVHGVPLIAWPLYAEQRTNAVSLAEDVKVAIRVKVNYKGLVGREEIVGCVRELMEGVLEGKLIRERMRKLKEKASLALSEQGSSTKSLTNVAQMWVNNNLKVEGQISKFINVINVA